MNTPSSEVSPGLWAFAAFFVLAIALWLLMRNMFVRLRRMNLAERVEQERQREEERAREEMAERAREIDDAGRPESGGVGDGPEEGQGRRDEV
ncbi:hypothetical protein ASG73_07590 [Janibacter sp. Soil728]|uniref:hypothetical protein n=1 Tax=Janibacter sp. Soil728 TaxID=1736393 RepID=UPI0006F4B99D|nr:hypothetical protein [Janibacter sp. Soil728]KRE37523.1 hypothetical protein ASG73_07590 [Janibacter sp. Soil728]